jgi:hypothetical protein
MNYIFAQGNVVHRPVEICNIVRVNILLEAEFILGETTGVLPLFLPRILGLLTLN